MNTALLADGNLDHVDTRKSTYIPFDVDKNVPFGEPRREWIESMIDGYLGMEAKDEWTLVKVRRDKMSRVAIPILHRTMADEGVLICSLKGKGLTFRKKGSDYTPEERLRTNNEITSGTVVLLESTGQLVRVEFAVKDGGKLPGEAPMEKAEAGYPFDQKWDVVGLPLDDPFKTFQKRLSTAYANATSMRMEVHKAKKIVAFLYHFERQGSYTPPGIWHIHFLGFPPHPPKRNRNYTDDERTYCRNRYRYHFDKAPLGCLNEGK